MTTLYKPIMFTVECLLAQELFILAGSPKVGKSWLALELCLAVAKGKRFLDCTTQQSSALYFCLEDSYQRIQSRLYELTDESSDKLFFALKADTIGNGLEEQITKFKSEHDDLRLVVTDTLQMVRNDLDSSYGSDYAELLPLKALAEQLNISIVLVHHLRKATDRDPFNMISGSTGLNGCVDGLFVLLKSKRASGQAVLHCTGRDIEDRELSLVRQGVRWVLAEDHEDNPPDIFVFAVHDLMVEQRTFKGSATELSRLLQNKFGGEFFANRLTRDLVRHAYELLELGVKFEHARNNGKRLIKLEYNASGDGSDGKKLMPMDIKSTDPTVTAGVSDCSESVENELPEHDSRSIEKFTDPLPTFTDPVNELADPEYLRRT